MCNLASNAANNWLRLPYIRGGGDANRLYVEIRFSMRRCTNYPDSARLQSCKEAFKLLYYEAESDFANAMMPTWDDATYRHVDVVAADRTFSDPKTAPPINTETRSITVSAGGVYFALHDQGACTTVLSMRVYYVVCASVIVDFAVFPNTSTGTDTTSVVQAYGTCVANAAFDDQRQPLYLCQADGNWSSYRTSGCHCQPGYQPGPSGTTECLGELLYH